jgi:hypothetical protein
MVKFIYIKKTSFVNENVVFLDKKRGQGGIGSLNKD